MTGSCKLLVVASVSSLNSTLMEATSPSLMSSSQSLLLSKEGGDFALDSQIRVDTEHTAEVLDISDSLKWFLNSYKAFTWIS